MDYRSKLHTCLSNTVRVSGRPDSAERVQNNYDALKFVALSKRSYNQG